MRKILLLAFVFIFTNIYGQENLIFEKVIQADKMNKSLIFIKVNEWFASNYNSANDVIQMADKEAGIIIGKGNLYYNHKGYSYRCYEGHIGYTIKAYMKDNRFKVEVLNFRHTVIPDNPDACELGLITTSEEFTNTGISKKYHNTVWSDIKTQSEIFSRNVFIELEKAVNFNSLKDDDW